MVEGGASVLCQPAGWKGGRNRKEVNEGNLEGGSERHGQGSSVLSSPEGGRNGNMEGEIENGN